MPQSHKADGNLDARTTGNGKELTMPVWEQLMTAADSPQQLARTAAWRTPTELRLRIGWPLQLLQTQRASNSGEATNRWAQRPPTQQQRTCRLRTTS